MTTPTGPDAAASAGEDPRQQPSSRQPPDDAVSQARPPQYGVLSAYGTRPPYDARPCGGTAQYAHPPRQGRPQRQAATDTFAVVSLVLAILWIYGVGSVAAIVFAVLAKQRIAATGAKGSGMATAGLVLGIIGVAGALSTLLDIPSR